MHVASLYTSRSHQLVILYNVTSRCNPFIRTSRNFITGYWASVICEYMCAWLRTVFGPADPVNGEVAHLFIYLLLIYS
jgi:hypothetical protein